MTDRPKNKGPDIARLDILTMAIQTPGADDGLNCGAIEAACFIFSNTDMWRSVHCSFVRHAGIYDWVDRIIMDIGNSWCKMTVRP